MPVDLDPNRFALGQRVVFRENESGPAEPGVIAEVVGPTDSHPRGGEYVILLDDDQGVVQAWHVEMAIER